MGLTQTGSENIDQVNNEKDFPVLLACVKGFLSEKKQLEILADIEKIFIRQIQVLLIQGDEFDSLAAQYGITGSPVYLFLENGRERDRYLGSADFSELHDFIKRNLISDRE